MKYKTETRISQYRRILKNVPFLVDLTVDELDEIDRLMVVKRFAKRQVVLLEEETAEYMYIIFAGKVRVVQLSEDGKERILAIHKKGDYFGEMSLFDKKTSPATVVAMEESEIGLLSKVYFERFVLKNERMAYQFITMLCMRLRESWMMLRIMSFADAEERVRAALKNIGQLYGVPDQRGVILALQLTHKDIANYASVSRETASRLLSRFTKQGEIEILEKKYILIKSSFSKGMVAASFHMH